MFVRDCSIAALLLQVLVAGAAPDDQAPPSCEMLDGSCPERRLSQEQALLQLKGVRMATKQRISTGCGSVRRRRRHAQMTACRRRHSSAGHQDTDSAGARWTCNEATHKMECMSADSGSVVGYPVTGQKKAAGLWCEVDIPPADWSLKSCPVTNASTTVKVLTYNLFWWNLFNRHQGSDRSAGRLIARTAGSEHYDFMAFQECDDRNRIMNDAGMSGEYETVDGGRAIAIAYRKSRWSILDQDSVDVGEDSHDQYYGKRSVVWARLQNSENKTVFFINHHGPLMVSQGGGCTGSATAMNIMRVIGENAHPEDVVILVGDFNAGPQSSRIQELGQRMHRVHSGTSMGGVDHIFSNCGADDTSIHGNTLGKGDGYYKSDHDALSATFTI